MNDNYKSFSDLDKELSNYQTILNSGVISTRDATRQVLFSYDVSENGADIKFTELGKSFFGYSENFLSDADPLTFAHYCGVSVENTSALKRKCGLHDSEALRIGDVISLANTESLFLVSSSESEAQIFDVDDVIDAISSKDMFIEGDSPEKLNELIKAGRVKHSSVRQDAEIYHFANNRLIPSTLTSTNQNASDEVKQLEARNLIFEYAALTALKLHNQHVVRSSAVRTEDGNAYLIKQRLDADEVSIDNVEGVAEISAQRNGCKFFASASWDRSVSTGEATNLEPHKVAKEMWQRVGANQVNRENLLTLYLFKQLVGSVNSDGFKQGDIRSIDSQGKVHRRLSPGFDFKIHLYNEENINTYSAGKLVGLSLSKLALEDIVYYDTFIKNISKDDKVLLEKCFDNALKIRGSMQTLISEAFVSKKLLTEDEANDFTAYLETPIGAKSNMAYRARLAKSNPFSERQEIAKENFIKKVSSMITDEPGRSPTM